MAKEAEKSKMEDLKKEVDMVCTDHCKLLAILSLYHSTVATLEV